MSKKGNGPENSRKDDSGEEEYVCVHHPVEMSEYDIFEPDFVSNSRLLDEISRKEHDILLGQCKGTLVSDGTRVVICCCRELADALCFNGAHIHEGRLYLARRHKGPYPDGEGGAFLIKEEPPTPLSACPFCHAVLIPHKRLAHAE